MLSWWPVGAGSKLRVGEFRGQAALAVPGVYWLQPSGAGLLNFEYYLRPFSSSERHQGNSRETFAPVFDDPEQKLVFRVLSLRLEISALCLCPAEVAQGFRAQGQSLPLWLI